MCFLCFEASEWPIAPNKKKHQFSDWFYKPHGPMVVDLIEVKPLVLRFGNGVEPGKIAKWLLNQLQLAHFHYCSMTHWEKSDGYLTSYVGEKSHYIVNLFFVLRCFKHIERLQSWRIKMHQAEPESVSEKQWISLNLFWMLMQILPWICQTNKTLTQVGKLR